MICPRILIHGELEILGYDPPRKTTPREVGNFGLRGSVCACLAGTIAVDVAEVMVSSKRLEAGA
ncbi:MAG: hypothetical protein RB191_22770 [Terriglobia bacterium]|nr:hypothetical protein [Terriglobia bacterium]